MTSLYSICMCERPFLFRQVTQALLFVKLRINSLYWKQVRYQKIHRERNLILQAIFCYIFI
uniref:Uncharacterized protein n=1 Tax=Anguilla anguilla TaxID=7936 RepID=A0A0E9REX8_ANGAN